MFPWKCLFSISDTNWSKNNFDDLYFVKVILEEISSWKYFQYKFSSYLASFVYFFWSPKDLFFIGCCNYLELIFQCVHRTLKFSWKFKEVLYYLQNNKVCTLVVGWMALKSKFLIQCQKFIQYPTFNLVFFCNERFGMTYSV